MLLGRSINKLIKNGKESKKVPVLQLGKGMYGFMERHIHMFKKTKNQRESKVYFCHSEG